MQINNYNCLNFESKNFSLPKNKLKAIIESSIESGMSVREVAKNLDKSEYYVYRALRIFDIVSPREAKGMKRYVVDSIMSKNINKYIAEKKSRNDIAQETGLTLEDIEDWLKLNHKKVEFAIRVDKFNQGLSHSEIASTLGLSISRVCQLYKELFQQGLVEDKNKYMLQKHKSIIDDIKNKSKVLDIAKKHDISPAFLIKIKKQYGVKEEMDKAEKYRILELAKKWYNIRDIAKELNISEAVLQNHIKKLGIKEELKSIYNQQKQDLYNDYKSGVRVDDLLEKYPISRRSAYNIIKKFSAEG